MNGIIIVKKFRQLHTSNKHEVPVYKAMRSSLHLVNFFFLSHALRCNSNHHCVKSLSNQPLLFLVCFPFQSLVFSFQSSATRFLPSSFYLAFQDFLFLPERPSFSPSVSSRVFKSLYLSKTSLLKSLHSPPLYRADPFNAPNAVLQ